MMNACVESSLLASLLQFSSSRQLSFFVMCYIFFLPLLTSLSLVSVDHSQGQVTGNHVWIQLGCLLLKKMSQGVTWHGFGCRINPSSAEIVLPKQEAAKMAIHS
jgi:hypothetical protein